MLGYNTAFFDDIDNKWQFDRVNDLSTTCYIKYSKNYYTYIQPLSTHQEKDFFETKEDKCIIPRANVYSSPESLGGIHKNIIPLYRLVMSKNHSIVELVATDKTRRNEYQMKTASYPNRPILHNYKHNNKCPMKFPNVINGFAIPFSLKQIPHKIKFQAIVTELYNFLNIDDLETMTINKKNYLEVK